MPNHNDSNNNHQSNQLIASYNQQQYQYNTIQQQTNTSYLTPSTNNYVLQPHTYQQYNNTAINTTNPINTLHYTSSTQQPTLPPYFNNPQYYTLQHNIQQSYNNYQQPYISSLHTLSTYGATVSSRAESSRSDQIKQDNQQKQIEYNTATDNTQNNTTDNSIDNNTTTDQQSTIIHDPADTTNHPLVITGPRHQKRRRKTFELNENERWYCKHHLCNKYFRMTSTKSIRVHKATCPYILADKNIEQQLHSIQSNSILLAKTITQTSMNSSQNNTPMLQAIDVSPQLQSQQLLNLNTQQQQNNHNNTTTSFASTSTVQPILSTNNDNQTVSTVTPNMQSNNDSTTTTLNNNNNTQLTNILHNYSSDTLAALHTLLKVDSPEGTSQRILNMKPQTVNELITILQIELNKVNNNNNSKNSSTITTNDNNNTTTTSSLSNSTSSSNQSLLLPVAPSISMPNKINYNMLTTAQNNNTQYNNTNTLISESLKQIHGDNLSLNDQLKLAHLAKTASNQLQNNQQQQITTNNNSNSN